MTFLQHCSMNLQENGYDGILYIPYKKCKFIDRNRIKKNYRNINKYKRNEAKIFRMRKQM